MADSGMPSTYATTTTTTRVGPIQLDSGYIKTIPGILKIAEIVLSLIVFFCLLPYAFEGSGFVYFVSLSAFITILIWFLVELFSFRSRLQFMNTLIEFVCYCIFTLFYLIAAIIAAVGAAKYTSYASIGACAFFAFCALAVFAVDTFFQFREWRSSCSAPNTTSTTTTTKAESGGNTASPVY